ncbi:MAG: cytoplasmic protein [Desulfovibrionaceae bacterium]
MQKTVLFAFQGELLCFVHVLLNALDLKERGGEVEIVLEGMSPTLVAQLELESNAFHGLWLRARGEGLVAGACKACSSKLGVLEEVRAADVPLLDGMSGHPPVAAWMERGFTVLTF